MGAVRGPENSSGVSNFDTDQITGRASTPAPVPVVTRLSDFNRDGRTDWSPAPAPASCGSPRVMAPELPAPAPGGCRLERVQRDRHPCDVTGDGNADVIVRTAAGVLRIHPGNGAGGLRASRQIASGWCGMTAITNAGDMTGDRRRDLLARDAAGRLWLYPMVGNARFQARRLVASGWAGMTAIQGPGDVSGDRRADILAPDRAGSLWLYRGNGAGRVAARTLVGSGWQSMTALVSPGNWNRAGRERPDRAGRRRQAVAPPGQQRRSFRAEASGRQRMGGFSSIAPDRATVGGSDRLHPR